MITHRKYYHCLFDLYFHVGSIKVKFIEASWTSSLSIQVMASQPLSEPIMTYCQLIFSVFETISGILWNSTNTIFVKQWKMCISFRCENFRSYQILELTGIFETTPGLLFSESTVQWKKLICWQNCLTKTEKKCGLRMSKLSLLMTWYQHTGIDKYKHV